MYIIDTHAHYDDERFDGDRDELLTSLSSHNIGIVINSGASMKGVRDTVALTEKYDFVYGSVGIHPSDVMELEVDNAYEELKSLALRDKIVAVGETGLDYYWDEPDREIQKKHFERRSEERRVVKDSLSLQGR